MNTQTISTVPQSPRTAPSAAATQINLTGASSAVGLRNATSTSKRLKEAQGTRQAQELASASSQTQELLALPAQVVGGLPAPVTLRLRVPGAPVPVVLWTGHIQPQSREATPVLADVIVFDGAELDAMVCACEADRLWHADFLGLCFEKWRRPEVPVRAAELLGGANPDESVSWTLGRVLARLGLEVETLDLDGQEPVARPLYEAA